MTNTISEAAQHKIAQTIARELNVGPQQVGAAAALLDVGETVPFVGRYRKEVTGNWTIPSSAIWKNGCSICGNSKNGAGGSWRLSRSKASSRTNCASQCAGRAP